MLSLRILALGLLLAVLGTPASAQDNKKEEPRKPDPNLGLGKDLLKEIDDLSVEDLIIKVTRAQNMLSRDGQKLLRFRVRLEDARKSADRALKVLDKDVDVDRLKDLFKDDAFKKDLLTIADVKDKQEQNGRLNDLLKQNGVSGVAALLRYATYKDASTILKECDEGLALVETEFKRNALTQITDPQGAGLGDLADVRAILDALKKRPPAPAPTGPETDLAEIIKRLAQ
jgi:hypothetical protein